MVPEAEEGVRFVCTKEMRTPQSLENALGRLYINNNEEMYSDFDEWIYLLVLLCRISIA